jgi:hypothetical protein
MPHSLLDRGGSLGPFWRTRPRDRWTAEALADVGLAPLRLGGQAVLPGRIICPASCSGKRGSNSSLVLSADAGGQPPRILLPPAARPHPPTHALQLAHELAQLATRPCTAQQAAVGRRALSGWALARWSGVEARVRGKFQPVGAHSFRGPATAAAHNSPQQQDAKRPRQA